MDFFFKPLLSFKRSVRNRGWNFVCNTSGKCNTLLMMCAYPAWNLFFFVWFHKWHTGWILSSWSMLIPYNTPLQWRPNERDGVSNLWRLDCLLNPMFRHRSTKTFKFHVAGFCEGNSPMTGSFLSQRASNEENVSICWRHQAMTNYSFMAPWK